VPIPSHSNQSALDENGYIRTFLKLSIGMQTTPNNKIIWDGKTNMVSHLSLLYEKSFAKHATGRDWHIQILLENIFGIQQCFPRTGNILKQQTPTIPSQMVIHKPLCRQWF
jgi:hypothetical protein